MSKPFRYYLRVRYPECDAQKIVFNARYGEYVDLASTEFMRAVIQKNNRISGEVEYKLVKQTTEWYASAKYDQILELSVYMTKLGNSSFTWITEIRIADSPDIICKVESIGVLVDPVTFEKILLPDDLKELLKEGAANQLTDHAGYLNTDR